jgi:hypothetical protein
MEFDYVLPIDSAWEANFNFIVFILIATSPTIITVASIPLLSSFTGIQTDAEIQKFFPI